MSKTYRNKQSDYFDKATLKAQQRQMKQQRQAKKLLRQEVE